MHEKSHYFECECASNEHVLKIYTDRDENEIHVSVFLHQYRSFFHRIWIAIKYIFNYKCRYGHWDGFIFRNEDIGRLKELLDQFEKLKEV